MFVYGVNHGKYAGEAVISNASCTTNGAGPGGQGAERQVGHQARPDDHRARRHRDARRPSTAPSRKDWRGGRGILENIIPSSTGAAKAVGKVIPELNKKLTGMASASRPATCRWST